MDVINVEAPIDTQINIEQFRAELHLNDEQCTALLASWSDLLRPIIKNADDRDRVLKNQLELIDLKNKSIADLSSAIETFKTRLTSILDDEEISSEIKQLILKGDIAAAEALVDEHYQEQDVHVEKSLASRCYQRTEIKELRLKGYLCINAIFSAYCSPGVGTVGLQSIHVNQHYFFAG